MYEGTLQSSMLFTEPSIKVDLVSSSSDCQLRALVIGGGGWTYNPSMSTGGGGSGYLKYHSQAIRYCKSNSKLSKRLAYSPNTQVQLTVGPDREASNIIINGEVIEAAPGHNGGGTGGEAGDGYSGGGYAGKHSGGSDGSNGEGGSGDYVGEGTGEDLASYQFDNFDLSPGLGGEYYQDPSCWFLCNANGGGGGGVLVNGEGPQDRVNNGQGFGGGGCNGAAHPGAVIIEIVKL